LSIRGTVLTATTPVAPLALHGTLERMPSVPTLAGPSGWQSSVATGRLDRAAPAALIRAAWERQERAPPSVGAETGFDRREHRLGWNQSGQPRLRLARVAEGAEETVVAGALLVEITR